MGYIKRVIGHPIIFGLLLFLVLFFICFSIFASFFRDREVDYTHLKKDYDKEYVVLDSTVPQFNLSSSGVSDLNKEIKKDFLFYRKQIGVTYDIKSYLSSSILSLVVSFTYTEEGNTLYETTKYCTYNYDLENEVVLSNQELLDLYGLTTKQVKMFLEQKFKNTYYYQLSKQQIDSSVTYSYFLQSKGIDNYMDNISFSVEKGSLICYRPFYITPINDDYKNFTIKDFRFVVVK